MAGSLLIILLGMLLVPSLGWRWVIRISITPSLILIFLFKVGSLHLGPLSRAVLTCPRRRPSGPTSSFQNRLVTTSRRGTSQPP